MLDIERVLNEKGISKSKLAELLGQNRSFVTNLISKGNPTVKTLEQIANVLDCEIVDLFTKSDDQNKITLYKKDDNGNFVVAGCYHSDQK